MSKVRGYRDLQIWQRSIDAVERCYRLTWTFPREERYGLASQLQRAAVSVPSNIAEGHERNSTKSYVYHLGVSRSSVAEVETQIEIAIRLGYVEADRVDDLLNEFDQISRVIATIIRKLDERAEG